LENKLGKISSWVAKLVDRNVKFDEDLGGIHFANGKADPLCSMFATQ
jgi:hypothetical protein